VFGAAAVVTIEKLVIAGLPSPSIRRRRRQKRTAWPWLEMEGLLALGLIFCHSYQPVVGTRHRRFLEGFAIGRRGLDPVRPRMIVE